MPLSRLPNARRSPLIKSWLVASCAAATSAPIFFATSSSVRGRWEPPPTTNRISEFGTPADANSRKRKGTTVAAGVGRLKSSTMIAALFLPFASSEIRDVPIGAANACSIWASESIGASLGPNVSTSQPRREIQRQFFIPVPCTGVDCSSVIHTVSPFTGSVSGTNT